MKPIGEVIYEHCLEALSRSDWNIAKAARLLGMPRGTLYGWVKRWGLVTGRERSSVGRRGVLSLDSFWRSPAARPYHRAR